MALNLADANRIINGAIAKAEELNIKVSVAVMDTGGRLLAFKRMDGAVWASVYGSQGKAVGQAGLGRPGMPINPDSITVQGIVAFEGHIILGLGGEQIRRGDVIEGACGVGGGTGEQDQECAVAGVNAL